MKKRICILYYDAGAGHKAVATALYNELSTNPNTDVSIVNFISKYQVAGFNKASQSYSFTLKYFSFFHGLIVKLVDTLPVLSTIRLMYKLNAQKHFATFLKEYPADVYISTSYYDNELFKYIKTNKYKAKTIMLVTDIVYALRIWFDKNCDQIILPTQEVYNNGLKYFKQYCNKVKILGLPIAKEYFKSYNINTLRKDLGLIYKQTVMISGGGEGMDKISKIAQELDKQLNDCNICVICGKNNNLLEQLKKVKFSNHVKLFSWTDDFAKLLIVADVFITKAGATSIWEAVTLNKKTIVFDLIKGQEEGNIEFARQYISIEYVTETEIIAIKTKELLDLTNNQRKQAFHGNSIKKFNQLLLN